MLVRPRNTEKTSAVLEKMEGAETGAETQPESNASPSPGHGRNAAEAFCSSRKIAIAHPKLKHGDRCPECGKGNVLERTAGTVKQWKAVVSSDNGSQTDHGSVISP